ncbi:MAG: hypothetical protein AB7J28_11035 [Hyphomonadaceae bacterium]
MNFIASFFRPGPETVLASPHPPEECARRLNEAMDSPMSLLGSKPALGTAGPQAAQLRRRTPYRNSFKQHMNVAIAPEGQGAKLSCRMSPSVFASVFLVFWCLVLLIMLFGIAAGVFAGELSPVFLIVPFIMLALGLGIAAIGRGLSNSDEPILLDFLRRTLDAR